MFSAVRVRLAAFPFLLLLASLPSQPAPATASSKPKDFGTSQLSTQMMRGAAAIAGIQSTNAVITNESVCTALFDQSAPVSVPDGGGGSIIVWSDYRAGNLDIYAQKLDQAGNIMWPADGVPICKQTGDQYNPRLLADGAGGAFVVWEDTRTSPTDVNIYIQRVNALGVNLWATGGVLVSGAANNQSKPVVSPNGLGGVLIAWIDERGAVGVGDIYAQRVTSAGAPQWTANGVAVCTATGNQQDPAVVTDTQGGAIVAWRDSRGADQDVYAQRVNSSGVVQWAANGVAISAATGNQDAPAMIADGSGGAILTWTDSRGADQDVYAQRISSAGAVQWTVDGVSVISAPSHQRAPRLCTDGAGGAYVVWEDTQLVGDVNVYAQRLGGATGAKQWAPAGFGVCTTAGNQLSPAIATDPVGGAIVAWGDDRNATTDVYAQHLQPGGSEIWLHDGVRLCDASGTQDKPDVVADGSGGASVSWRDYRNTSYSDIYAQRVDAGGQIPDQCVPPDTLATNSPITTAATQNYKMFNQGWFYWSGVAVRGAAGSDWDIETYDQGSAGLGAYPTCFGLPLAGSYGTTGVDFVITNFNDNHTPPGVFGVRAYRYSGSGNAALEWDDGPDQFAVGTPVGEGSWTGPLSVYDIQLTAGVSYTFELAHTQASDIKVLLFTSYGAPGGGYYYVVPRSARVMETGGRYGTYTAPSTEFYGVAVVNDNGVPSDYVLTVRSGVTGVGGEVSPTTRLMSLSPNPGRGPVDIRFAMRETGMVSFQIFDMAGRAVASIPTARWQPGNWSTQWNGRDQQGHLLSAGIYFVQMNVNDRRVGMGRLALVH